MPTAVTFPARSRARVPDAGTGPSRLRWRRWRATAAGVAVAALAGGCLLVANDLSARSEIRTSDVSLAGAVHRLSGIWAELPRVEGGGAGARARRAAVTRSFAAAQGSLATTEAALSRAQQGMESQGVDLGKLDSCLSGVEEALNQIAVGQTGGGLASLRASSSSCAVLSEVG
jgi:hypothetical protein